jgi:hypothetical protein
MNANLAPANSASWRFFKSRFRDDADCSDQRLQAGNEAVVERNRRGLEISLIAIGIVLAGLRLYIKKIES